MRLLSLRLSGFRGFSEPQEIDLDADAVIVNGANGQGKTSLLDSILWCLTGQLPRIGDDAQLVSLYSSSGILKVELVLGSRDAAPMAVGALCRHSVSRRGVLVVDWIELIRR